MTRPKSKGQQGLQGFAKDEEGNHGGAQLRGSSILLCYHHQNPTREHFYPSKEQMLCPPEVTLHPLPLPQADLDIYTLCHRLCPPCISAGFPALECLGNLNACTWGKMIPDWDQETRAHPGERHPYPGPADPHQ